MKSDYTGREVAVIGMAGRFPGAENITEFWNNLRDGVESISFFEDEELLAEGENKSTLSHPQFVKANSFMPGKENFDSAFFNYRPDEAKMMDPQIRVLQECVWQALEDAAVNLEAIDHNVGVFMGAGNNFNWQVYARLMNNAGLVDNLTLKHLGNARFISTRIAYLLNLKGPALFNDTACSTSLVNIDQACKSLLFADCKVAVAGGVTINYRSKKGYFYQEGMIQSKDGHCRAFDKDASGTIGGQGVGVVVLKKLTKAIEDGDHIYAIIRGSSINNDGNEKLGYSAPSVEGQTEVALKARKMSKVEPESIGYVETHGTGTVLGDPIEVEALNLAFGPSKEKYCALGSVKTNIGHLDAAAGIAGFIKAVLAIKNRQIPPSLNFKEPNPKINFENSPFYVNTELKEWQSDHYPLRAGVGSFGIGGTNAHVILEEAPTAKPSSNSRPYQLINLSAKTPEALARNVENLRAHLELNPNINLADAAYSLKLGRSAFAYRKTFVSQDLEEALTQLNGVDLDSISAVNSRNQRVVFMFPGQGSQYLQMGKELYEKEKLFRTEVDQCFRLIEKDSGRDLSAVWFADNSELLDTTAYTQPALFVVEYALARLMMSWGISPDYMIGHSIGEYVAACISGVFTLEDALKVVVKRGELMQQMAAGDMLSVSATPEELSGYLEKYSDVSLATVNSSALSVVSGGSDQIAELKQELDANGILNKVLNTSHAFHSAMMDDMLEDFQSFVSGIQRSSVGLPFISNLTGKPISDDEATSPQYWTDHLRQTVQFAGGVEFLMDQEEELLFVEVGPGRGLSSFVGAHEAKKQGHQVVNLLRKTKGGEESLRQVLDGLGKLWTKGIKPDWKSFYAEEQRSKVSLPTYSFEQTKYPVDVDAYEMISKMISKNVTDKSTMKRKLSDWFYTPTWKVSPELIRPSGILREDDKAVCNLIFVDQHAVAETIFRSLKKAGETIIQVKPGPNYEELENQVFIIDPGNDEDYRKLFENLKLQDLLPDRVIHCWGISDNTEESPNNASELLEAGFYSLFRTIKLSHESNSALQEVSVITNDLHDVFGEKTNCPPEKSLVQGLLKVIAQEFPTINTGSIDVKLKDLNEPSVQEKLVKEVQYVQPGKIVSLRNSVRFVLTYDQIRNLAIQESPFRNKGVYLITGGLGGFGFCMAQYLSEHHQAKLILLGREALPDRSQWTDYSGKESVKQKIAHILSIEKKGGEVSYMDCDISSEERFREVVRSSEEQFGEINGVFHAAGVLKGASMNPITVLERADFDQQFAPKLEGLRIVAEVFGPRDLDFCILTSSLSAILGGLRFAGYASGNTFMDYFIRFHRNNRELPNWISVNFDGINFDDRASEFIDNEELPEVIKHLISLKELSQVVVSTKELQTRIDNWVNKNSLSEDENVENLTGDESLEEPSDSDQPETLEEKIQKIWQKFFGKQIGLGEDFFEIGGDSLKALTLIARINKQLSVKLSLADFFEKTTIKSLAAYIADLDESTHEGIEKAEEKSLYPLSSSQKRMYFIHEFEKASLAYNLPQVVKLEGALDEDRVRRAFERLIDRHESLRTSFELQDGNPYQKVHDSIDLEVERFEANESEAKSVVRQFIRPFDISKAPLIRVGIIKISEAEHLLMVDLHHIITDGVSQGIVVKDFFILYNNLELPEQKFQYRDYSEWQNSEAYQNKLVQQRNFWLEEFSEYTSVQDLPTDFTRPKVKSYTGKSALFTLEEEITTGLREISSAEGTTMFMTLLSVFNILLSKLTNTEEVVVGTVVAGREHSDLEKIMGLFVNTLALRNFPQGDLTFREFLQTVKAKTLACFDNNQYQYEDLIEELNVPRDTSRNPLFDVLFGMQNFDQGESSAQGFKMKPYAIEQGIAKFDLTLRAMELKDRILMNFEYSTELFQEETIQKFITYLRQVIREVIEDQEVKISAINLLDSAEKASLLSQYSETVRYPEEKSIVHLFKEQVGLYPEKIAVQYQDETISYQDLDLRSDYLAEMLVRKGLKSNEIVGLYLDRSVEMIISMLAILKAGGAYLPLEIGDPKDRISYLLDDCKAKVLLTSEALQGEIEHPNLLCIPEKWEEIASAFKGFKYTGQPSDLCYVIYTSGTTGNPKGVMVEHRNVIALFFNERSLFDFDTNDVWTMFHSHAFDFSVWEMYGALLHGGKLIIVSKAVAKDTPSYLQLLKEEQVTVLNQTPGAFYNLAGIQELENSYDLALRYVVFGGEALNPARLKRWHANNPNVKLVNMYGITETTIHVTYKEISEQEINSQINTIGVPLPHANVLLMDSYQQLVPKGIKGEMYVGGLGVARGYLNNEELTDQKFIENPFQAGERLYRSGDLARWLDNGELEYLGRADHQVKIRGYRIELGEIQSQIQNVEDIKEALVLTRERRGFKYLVAYCISNKVLSASDLKTELLTKLPEHMVPSHYVFLEQFPLTSNGKVARGRLPEPQLTDEENYLAPSNELEEKLQGIWQEQLRVDRIGIRDNFFAVGGDSMKAISLISKINQELSLSVNIADLYEYQTIELVANYIQLHIEEQVSVAEREDIMDEFAALKERFTSDDTQ